jgi:EmrB/QacA subfamily drug resistance transporter
MLPAVLDQTILATALPTIALELGRITDVSWVVTAYVVAAAATTPLWGKLGDRHGHKPMLALALALFLGASALCGVVQDVTMLMGARVVQGAAAGGLMTLAMAAIGDLVSPRERARFQGYIAATFALATVAGPLIGGVLVEHASWRWVFYVNLPLGLLALAGLHLRLSGAAVERPGARLDAAGAALLAAATSAFMLVCIWGGTRYAWGSPTIVALAAVSAVAAAALVLRERRAADPIVPVDLLRTPTVAIASAALFLATAALFAMNVFVPLFLQVATGATPTEAGLLLVPAMLGITVSTNYAGRAISRTGRYKRYPLAGLALMTATLVWLAVVVHTPSRLTTAIGLAVMGLGFGMVGQVLIVAVQNGVDRSRLGIAMATTSFFRGLGGAVGAALLGAVFAARAGAAGISGGADAVGALGPAARADVIDAVERCSWSPRRSPRSPWLSWPCSRRSRCGATRLPVAPGTVGERWRARREGRGDPFRPSLRLSACPPLRVGACTRTPHAACPRNPTRAALPAVSRPARATAARVATEAGNHRTGARAATAASLRTPGRAPMGSSLRTARRSRRG